MKKINNKYNKGFGIIEVSIGVVVFSLIIGAVTLLTRNVFFYNSFLSVGLNDADQGRNLMKDMTREIRTASLAETGGYIIGTATDSSFTFYSDIDNDGLKEKVRYFKNGTLLQKGIIEPTGSPLNYSGIENIKTVISNVTNSTIFEYHDKYYSGTQPAMTIPINIPLVRLIKITVIMDKDANRAPAPMTFSTQVSIRNLKDNWNE